MITEREIKELVQTLMETAADFEEFKTNVADVWHESLLRIKKETYQAAHAEGYADGTRDCREGEKT